MTVGHGFRNSSLLSSLLLAFTGIFVSMPRPASALERVRVALSVRNVVFLPFYYASDTKIFERYGLHAELIQMRSDLQLAGLISGEIDFTPAVGPATLGVANAMPVKALAILYRAPLFSLVSPPSVLNLKDLEGRRVAVSRIGSDSHRFGALMLEKQPEQTRNMLRVMRDFIATIRRDKPGIVAYIEKNFKVTSANAMESYEDINGVVLDAMMMREDQIQKYLDGAHARGEILRP